MLLTMKYYGKRHPKLKWLRPLGPISACVIAIIAAVAGDLEHKGIRIVGKIPKGEAQRIYEAGSGDAYHTVGYDVGAQACEMDLEHRGIRIVGKIPKGEAQGVYKGSSMDVWDRLQRRV